jgi:ABC-type glycerol-3-phosphate transport system substrate-binding protein
MIPAYSKKPQLAEKFLLFLSGEDIQAELNEKLQMFPANINAKVRGDYFTKYGSATLITAEGTTQFFDRDTSFKTSKSVLPILADFMPIKMLTGLLLS